MTNEWCTNMRRQHLLCISYITRGYSHQMLLCFSIIRMVSSFIQAKWKTTLKKNNKNKNKINKQTKNKRKRQKTNKTILCNIYIPFNLCPYSYCFILGAIFNISL